METTGINQYLEDHAQNSPNQTAVIEPTSGTRLTYNELYHAVDRTSRRLDTAGICPDHQVAVLMNERFEFVLSVLSLMKLGAKSIILDKRLNKAELKSQIKNLSLDYCITADQNEEKALSLLSPDKVLSIVSPNHSQVRFIDKLKTGPKLKPTLNVKDVASIMFTSGSTGEPKPVKLTHGNFLAHCELSCEYFDLSNRDAWLAPLPMAHMGGFGPIVRCFYSGATILISQYEFPDIIDTLRAFNVTALSLVPKQAKKLLKHPSVFPPPSLQFLLVGGGPVPSSLIDKCRQKDIPLHASYGATETTSHVAVADPASLFNAPDDCGAEPLDAVSISINNPGNSNESSPTGEIIVSGPVVSPGYVETAQHTNTLLQNQQFQTGDVGYLDSKGRLHVEGRIDDMINSGGELISPRKVEEKILQHKAVQKAIITGVESEEWGQALGAWIVPKQNQKINKHHLKNFCLEEMASFKIPKTWVFDEKIPTQSDGKIDRTEIKRQLKDEDH